MNKKDFKKINSLKEETVKKYIYSKQQNYNFDNYIAFPSYRSFLYNCIDKNCNRACIYLRSIHKPFNDFKKISKQSTRCIELNDAAINFILQLLREKAKLNIE